MKGDTPSACMNSSNLSLSSSRYVPSMPTYASGMLRLDTVLSCLFNSATILNDWRVTMLGGQLPLIRRIRPALVFPISTSQCQSGRKPQGSLESSAIIVSRYSQIWPLRNTLNCLPNYVWMTVSPKITENKFNQLRRTLSVLHCNYNWKLRPIWDLVITFDWGALSTICLFVLVNL